MGFIFIIPLIMTEQILLTPMESPRRKFWKKWKWIGLAIFAVALLFRQWLPGFVVTAANVYGIVVIANLAIFIFRYLRDWLFWRVRNRLIGSFIFVGVLPLLIILGLASLAIYLVFAQLAGQYLNTALQENTRLISEMNVELAGHIASTGASNAFPAKAASVFSNHSAQFPRLAARLLRRLPDGTLALVSKYDPHSVVRDLSPHPGDKWREGAASFEGILDDGERILLTSFRPVPEIAGLYVETAAPVDRSFEDRLRQEKSLYVTFIAHDDADVQITGEGEARVTIKSSGAEGKAAEKQIEQELDLQNAYIKSDPRRMISWYLALKGKVYDTGKNDMLGLVIIRAPWAVIFKTYLIFDDGLSQALVTVFKVLIALFVVVELLSLLIGGTINRHITRSVHDLYQGILALQKGDLQHKIPVRRKDQLGLLAHSFNQMSGSIERLLEEVVEKRRLEQELEIAREVQATLFPKQLPHPPGMSIFGGCKPARIVSGDYYDFIVEDETHLNIVVGDISGKGISAALLMASLQAAMRSQLLSSKRDDPAAIGQSLANVMAQVNQQIYLSSPPEKYATLFLSRYDAESRRLWYCNAGHLPPIVLNAHGAQALEATGMVVGMFPDANYEARSIELPPGALLAIFTDGVTEALNKADEEFGDKQLLTALQQSHMRTPEGIWQYVMARVGDWQSDLPQYDDITLIVAKAG
jgi:sigma-B regulation protein RsbU (phosphoserine phosphatase)